MKNLGLYIHYPFCKRVCYYCHFTKQTFDKELSKKYIAFLLKELELKGDKNKIIDTIYFGGGSPGLIGKDNITEILKTISDFYTLSNNIEITIEINPEDADADKLRFFKRIGFNRISIGTQSFNSDDLKYLKRNHSAELSLSVIDNVKTAGFTNISTDFIIGLPTQSKETLVHGFNIVKQFDIPHLSVYVLEGVKEENDNENKLDEYLYFQTEAILKNLEYSRYEVSNYSIINYESRHNSKYWENKEYIGVGLSASGYESGIDYKNTENLGEYFDLIKVRKLPIKEKSQIIKMDRQIITGLRTSKGVKTNHFKQHQNTLKMLLKEQILIENNGYISIKSDKILLLNEILTYFR